MAAHVTEDPEEGSGVNDRVQLAHLERLMRKRINERHMKSGVTMIDPAATYIDSAVTIGRDTVLYPGTFLLGATQIGKAARLGRTPTSRIWSSRITRGFRRFPHLTGARTQTGRQLRWQRRQTGRITA